MLKVKVRCNFNELYTFTCKFFHGISIIYLHVEINDHHYDPNHVAIVCYEILNIAGLRSLLDKPYNCN